VFQLWQKSDHYDSNVIFTEKKIKSKKTMPAFWKRLKENQECSIGKTKTITMFVTNITKPSFLSLKSGTVLYFVCLFFKGNVLH
jgi:hypothetical protein